jgi:exonuclease SbcD
MKILHCADLQLGVTTHSGNRLDPATGMNVRVADLAARWLDCCTSAVDERVDAFLFAGDAFEYPSPTIACQNAFARGVKLVADAGIPVVLLTGNHDITATAGRVHALSMFQTLEVLGVHVIDRPTVLWFQTRHGRLAIAGLPWPTKNWTTEAIRGGLLTERDALLGAYLEMELDSLTRQIAQAPAADNRGAAILLAHIGVSEAEAGSESGMMLGREVQLPLSVFRKHKDVFDYVGLGHYHRVQGFARQTGLGPAWINYAGSMDRVDFGEIDDPKGWLIVELGGEVSPVIHMVEGRMTAARRFVDVTADCREQADPTAHTLRCIRDRGDLSECVVRVRVWLKPEQEALWRDSEITAALAGAWTVAPFMKEIDRPARLRLGEDVGEVAALTPTEAFEKYLSLQTSMSNDNRAALRAAGGALMRQVDSEQGG